jgi:hypothetical protein
MTTRSAIALVIAIGLISISTAQAQAPAPAWPAWKTEKITDDICVIFGEGGNTTVFLAAEGVIFAESFPKMHGSS